MPSRNIPNVNASLIREARMIAQQLLKFGAFDRLKTPKEQPKPAAVVLPQLKCAFCAPSGKVPENAHTVIKGYAVCMRHQIFVQDDSFMNIVNRIVQSQAR